jgi:uncharacterized delta-60 repeat protein
MGRIVAFSVALLVALIAAPLAHAGSAGDLDPSFGHHGRVVLTNANGTASAVDIGRRRRIVVAGSDGNEFNVVRLRPYGRLDHSFSRPDGIATIRSSSDQAATTALAISRKGSIILVGMACVEDQDNCHLDVYRLRRNGVLSRSFGHNGHLRLQFNKPFDTDPSVVLTRRGRIIIEAMDCSRSFGHCNMGIARLDRDGLDTTFGDGGKVTIPFKGRFAGCGHNFPFADVNVGAMAVDSNGRIVGLATCAGTRKATLVRLKPSGHLDRSFGLRGRVKKDVGMRAVTALATDSRDRIDVAGAETDGFGFARFRRDGRLDTSFGHRGTMRATFPRNPKGPAVPFSIALDSHKRIVAGGSPGRFDVNAAFARLKANGHVDRGFGRRGTVRLKRGRSLADSLAIDSRDRIVGAGSTAIGNFAVVRLLG